MMTPNARVLSAILLCSAALSLAGCAWGQTRGMRKGGLIARITLAERERLVPIDGAPVTTGRFMGLDVHNPAGGVFVEVHSRYDEARITARIRDLDLLRKLADAEGWDPDSLRGPWYVAEHDLEGEVGALRVKPTAMTLPDGSRPLIDLHVHTPVCDGSTIRANHGDVELIGVRGALDVEADGLVEVRTNEPLVDELRLRSETGGVLVVTSPLSRGTFLITAPHGRANFTSAYGTPQGVSSERGRWTGVWNSGTNPVTLHAEHGHARYMVKERAELYTPGFN